MRERIDTFNAQNVANTLWACGSLGVVKHGSDVFEALQRRGLELIATFNAQDVSNFIMSCAKLGIHPGKEIFTRLCRRVGDIKPADFSALSVSNFLWACGALGAQPCNKALKIVCNTACEKARELNAQQLANTLWGCAVLDCIPDGLRIYHAAQTQNPNVWEALSDDPLGESQMSQFLLSVDLQAPESARALNYRAHVQHVAATQIQVSLLQRDVAECIKRLGHVYVQEAVDAKSGYTIDVLVDGKVAVEVDGPSHFLAGSKTPSGSTLIKRRHLNMLGYKHVAVLYWEWDALAGVREKDEYIRALLSQ